MSPSHKQRAGSKPAEALVDQGIPGTRCKVCEAKGQEVRTTRLIGQQPGLDAWENMGSQLLAAGSNIMIRLG
ncbi:unnamed protein product [Fusarium graminearum]|uniref:Chromosome 3, complete genome n=1 Tax=Gibberella zeae (strain ATCC MYA-4620 / CBS 123657 / FGSC 9075 / NRRL 31084 / PH-1) TaxID=229533 RepID=A0A098E2W8_GIBZE|nr:unnamed protein product [Fusarium graminearum]CEF87972.1 unnamed protein product [Fusarium graminearum]CZS85968.1 unnamed protein product [Fusarium graminearum]